MELIQNIIDGMGGGVKCSEFFLIHRVDSCVKYGFCIFYAYFARVYKKLWC